MTDPTPTRDEAVPTGWKLVPIEPTPEMIQAACDATFGPTPSTPEQAHRAGYHAMLASAPAPASGGVDAVAWRDVLAERRRQVEAEGWTAEHDDEHGNGEMARAAASYALEHATWTYTETPSARLMEAARSVWPWGKEWWKPGASRRMLVKAAALILAEIERLDRKEGVR